jgi:diguanylate cyclase
MAFASWYRRRARLVAWLVSLLLGLGVAASGIGIGIERALDEAEAHLRSHAGSGSIHIVEIDARSIASIRRWPWPRDNHAKLVDQLRSAGVASIVFDVDFSSESDPAADTAFAAALARANGQVVLPTFGQGAGAGSDGWTDSLPIPILRENATLAAVSILPDRDGAVRRAPLGTVTAGAARPSLSAIVANVDGQAYRDFPIDFAIDPATIPRHSFIDIRDGKFDAASLAGKRVLVGATAVEMGDRYAVPNHGVIPGVVIQALSAETLARGVPGELGALPGLLLALALAWPVLCMRETRLFAALALGAPAVLFGISVAARSLFHCTSEIVPGLAALACAGTWALTMRLLAAAKRRRMHDQQTGLPNRLALHALDDIGSSQGIIAARIADFDKIAAALGDEAASDLVLRVNDRIMLVAGDGPIYRVEDRLLAWRCEDAELLGEHFATLRTLMLSPIEVTGRRVDVTLTFGFARVTDGDRPDTILARAMLAADSAISSAEGWQVHDRQADENADRELSLLGELDEAVHKGEIEVYYQPKLCLKSGRIVSVEALVRWNHGTRGFLRPDLFIPLAERNDRIAGLTLHVLQQTIRDLEEWRRQGHEVSGAVNLSAKLLGSPSFIAELGRHVTDSTLPPQMLTFEVTESAAMTDTAGAAAALRTFQELGIGISMDDYGTGQSTLSYIKQLPLNELKIDRSFVQFAHQNRSDGVLVQSTVNLAHELGLKVVAEGVEDEECLAYLRAIGCDMAQGYLISRPVPAAQLKDLLGSVRRAA